ncbi:Ribonuclease H [Abeliophyllum distichum]|uniref:Ribonuclease H n=1 Tax=Abeliophyllum distichum TaxID=126358 RepID=A0ABD1RSW6_9LAMI
MKDLEWPKPMVAPAMKRDKKKYCQFHRDHGHNAESCIQKEDFYPISGGDFNSARKIYARSTRVCSIQRKEWFDQDIIFGKKDLVGVYEDALVVVGDIVDFNIRRVLVDGGSAADVLSWDALWA